MFLEEQWQIQEIYEIDETFSKDSLCGLTEEREKELERFRQLVTKCKHLIIETRVGPPSDATSPVSDYTRRAAKVKITNSRDNGLLR